MRSSGNKNRVEPLNWKQRFILTFFFLEVLIYPFIVAQQLEGGEFEPHAGNRIRTAGIGDPLHLGPYGRDPGIPDREKGTGEARGHRLLP